MRYRHILVTYASGNDAYGLDHAVNMARAHGARLTVAVPVEDVSWMAGLACVNIAQLRQDGIQEANHMVREASARVPTDVSLVVRCVPRRREHFIARDIAHGTFDLFISCDGRRDPGAFWGRMGLRLARAARRCGVGVQVMANRPGASVLAPSPAELDEAP